MCDSALMGSHALVEGSQCPEVGSSNSGALVGILCCVQKLALITERIHVCEPCNC